MKKNTQRVLTLLLAVFMVIGILPISGYAAVEKPNWEKAENQPVQQYWPLPEITSSTKVGIAQIGNAGFVGEAGEAGLTHAALNYENHYTNKDGNLVIKLSLAIDGTSVTSSPWKIVDLHFDPNLYENISDESYAYSNFRKKKMTLTRGTGIANERTFGLEWGKTDIYLIMNAGVTWEKVKEGKKNQDSENQESQKQDLLVQARLYNTDRSKVWSKSSRKKETNLDKAGFKNPSYNTYTLSTVIPTVSNIMGDLVLKNTEGNSDTQIDATNTRIQFMPDSKKMRVAILRTNQAFSSNGLWNDRHMGVRQYFTGDFYKLLDLTSDEKRFLKVYIRDHNYDLYKTDKPQLVNSELINVLEGKGYYVQLVDANFTGLESEKKHTIATKDITKSIINYGLTKNPVSLVFEYTLTDDAVKDILDNPELLNTFTFNTEYMVDHEEPWTKYEWTITEEDVKTFGQNGYISIPKGDEALRVVSAQDKYLLESHKDLNVIIETEGSKLEYNWKDLNVKYPGQRRSEIYVPTVDGLRLKAGDKITVLFPFGELKSYKNDFNQASLVWKDGTNTRTKKFIQSDRKQDTRPNRFRNGQQMVGASVARTEYNPKVDEIFTNSIKIKGQLRYANQDVRMTQGEFKKDTKSSETATAIAIGDKKYSAYEFSYPVEGLNLSKDAPISFTNKLGEDVESNKVIEQVQAKVNFNLDENKTSFIEKIAPLNKEYSFNPKTGEANAQYKASGFEGDNLKVDEEKTKVQLDRTPLDGSTGENNLKPSYPNFLNHDGEAYNLTKVEEKNEFLKRIFPDSKYDADLRKDGKIVRGWTTQPLKDIIDGKTAIEQYNDLVKEGKVITKAEDWQVVDGGENYVFTSNSPLDETLKTKEVYAVWAGPSLILHSNNTTEDKETLVYLPYTQADKVYTDKKIDAITSSTVENLKRTNTIKNLPMAPYRFDTKDTSYDRRLDSFRKENSTFAGWTLTRHNEGNDKFFAGNNNERIEQINNGKVKNVVGNQIVEKSIPVKTEGREFMVNNPLIAYIPNGFDYAENKNLDTILKEGKDIHLYANYKEYFTITVHPRYREIEGKDFSDANGDGNFGVYRDTVSQDKKHNLKMGLLYRTAVTNYNEPTVLQGATYNPVKAEMLVNVGDPILQDYNSNTGNSLTWTLPGLDNMGRRRSFVSIVVPEGKEAEYEEFNEGKWATFGITIYVNRKGQSGEAEFAKDAPKELHEEAKPVVYGTQLAKQQSFSIAKGVDQVDTYTSATFRKPTKADEFQGKIDFTGYEIYSTNTPSEVPTPKIHKIMDTDTSITLTWEQAEKNSNIQKIKLTIPVKVGEAVENKEYILELQDNGTYTLDGMTATLNQDGTMTIESFNFEQLVGKTVRVQYINNLSVPSETGKTEIETLKESNKVTQVVQNPIDDVKTTPSITMTIPNEDPTNQVLPGTTYVAEKWDGQAWVEVGRTTVPNGKGPGDRLVIDLENVADNDLVRINAKEVGKIETPSINTTLPKPETDSGYVFLDLVGPSAIVEAKDEIFRRWVEIKGTFDEIPEGPITISFNRNGNPETATLENKGIAYEYLRSVIADGNITDIKISAKDEFGNKKETDVIYDKTHVLVLTVRNVTPGRKYIQVKSEYDNTQVTLNITTVDGKTFTVGPTTVGTSYTKIKFIDEAGQEYRVKEGDQISIEGVCNHTDGKTYTSNPYTEFVEEL